MGGQSVSREEGEVGSICGLAKQSLKGEYQLRKLRGGKKERESVGIERNLRPQVER